jgi:hypothetical protein
MTRRIARNIMPKLRARAAGIADVTDIIETSEPIQAASVNQAPREAISKRAYELWLERGCPEGSPEADWFKAESEVENPRDSRLVP